MTVSGGEGNDTITFINTGNRVSVYTVNGNGGDDSITLDGGANDANYVVKAGIGDDTISIGAANEAGNASIHASAGDDVLTGVDAALGTLIFDDDAIVDADDAVSLSTTDIQNLATGSSIKIADGIFDTVDFSGLTKDFKVTGDNAVNTIKGGTGADTIDGSTQGDFLTGGAGIDTYIQDEGDSVATEEIDAVADNATIEDADVIGTAIWTFTEGVDVITDFAEADIIDGIYGTNAPIAVAAITTAGAALDDSAYVLYGVYAVTTAGTTVGTFTGVGAYNATNAKDAIIYYTTAADKAGVLGSTSTVVFDDLAAALDADNFV